MFNSEKHQPDASNQGLKARHGYADGGNSFLVNYRAFVTSVSKQYALLKEDGAEGLPNCTFYIHSGLIPKFFLRFEFKFSSKLVACPYFFLNGSFVKI